MAEDVINQFLSYGVVFGAGIALSGIGILLAIVFKSTEKAGQRGLDQPLDLNFTEQFLLAKNNLDIFIPLCFMFAGVLLIISAVGFAVYYGISLFF